VLVDGVLGSRDGSDVSRSRSSMQPQGCPGVRDLAGKKSSLECGKPPRLTRTAVDGRRMGARVVRGILTDEAHDWTLRGRKHVGRHETVSGVLHRSDVRLVRVGREAVLAEWVNPRTREAARWNAYEAAVSRLEPVIRAHEATRMPDVGTSWFRLFQPGGRHRARGVSIRGPRRKPRDVQESPAGRLPKSAKGMRRGRDRRKRAKLNATLTSREFQATRMDLDRAGSHTER
jgi:hypothetical protein